MENIYKDRIQIYILFFVSHKQQEARETKYWMELLIEGELVSEQRLSLMYQEIEEIIAILAATFKKLKQKHF